MLTPSDITALDFDGHALLICYQAPPYGLPSLKSPVMADFTTACKDFGHDVSKGFAAFWEELDRYAQKEVVANVLNMWKGITKRVGEDSYCAATASPVAFVGTSCKDTHREPNSDNQDGYQRIAACNERGASVPVRSTSPRQFA